MAYFKDVPFMMVQNAGREGDDHAHRCIFNVEKYKEIIEYCGNSYDISVNDDTTIVDDIYDTSSSVPTKGRRWMLPFKFPTVMAQLIRSSNVMNERGFYVTDTLRIVLNVGDVQRLLPDMITDPSKHIKDRIIYRGEVYVPTRVLPRGSFGNRWAVVTIDCNQVNPEELVNDPQFQNYAQPSVPDRRSTV
jgi:hypothetical protein